MENKKVETVVSMRDLILALFKDWKIITVITAAAVLIGMVYSFLLVRPVYSSSISGNMDIQQKITNKFGDYTFPSVVSADYINDAKSTDTITKTISDLKLNMTVQELKGMISIVDDGLNVFTLVINADTQDKANQIVTALSTNFVEVLRVKYRGLAIEDFLGQHDRNKSKLTQDLKVEETNLAGLKTQIAQIDPFITVQTSQGSEQLVNPSYAELIRYVIKSESEVQLLKVQLANSTALYDELLKEKDGLKKFMATGDRTGMVDPSLDVWGTAITMSDSPSFTSLPLNTKKSVVLVIMLLAGLALGAVTVLTKNYIKGKW